MRCRSFDNFFGNFASKTKLNIIKLLRERPLSVNEIAKELNEEQSKISHSLKKLIQCNILKFEQKGKQRIYELNKETIIPLLDLVKKHVKSYCKECNK